MEGSSSGVDPEWRQVVARLLGSWVGYQLALQHQTGGSETEAKNQWLIDTLAEHIATRRGLQAYDLQEWLDSIVDAEFDLVLEDESTLLIADSLLSCWRWLSSDRARLATFLAGLPDEQRLRSVQQSSRGVEGEDVDSDELEDIDEDMEQDEAGGERAAAAERVRQPRTETDQDGWTTILPRQPRRPPAAE